MDEPTSRQTLLHRSWPIPALTLMYIGLVCVVPLTEDARLHPGRVLALAGCFLLFSGMGIADDMHWNRARREAGRFALNRLDCPPEQVDGGLEWGGWMSYDQVDHLPEGDPCT